MPRPPQKKLRDEDQFAALCIRQRAALLKAGRRLHDDIGSLLAAAGLKLQLLKMDFPQAGDAVNETIEHLDAAFEQLRTLSQELLASPVHRGGLRQAMAQLAEHHPEVTLADTSAAQVPPEPAAAIYEVAAAAIDAALQAGARSIRVTMTGKAGISIRIADDSRTGNRARSLSGITKLAALAHVRVEFATKKGKIVSIRYALRRPARG